MASAEDSILPPFHIRNLRSPLDLVHVSPIKYGETLLSDSRAALRYNDDDGDVITVCPPTTLYAELFSSYLRSALHSNWNNI